MVIWLMGISGAGKTTLGLKLKEFFDEKGRRSYMIDGDWVRDFYENDLGYSKEERMANIKRIILAAHALSENDIITIVCNISPFEELRELCRKRIKNYNEIYLKRELNSCRKNDVKNVYRSSSGKTALVGVDLAFEKPLNSNLVIDVDSEDVAGSFSRIVNYLKTKYPEKLR